MEEAEGAIPADAAAKIRSMVHDIANALETVVMTHYLLGMGEQTEQTKQWLGMMEAGIQKAATLNRQIGEYIHQHS